MMFSLSDIDFQISVFYDAAAQMDEKADLTPHTAMQMCMRGTAEGLREAARSLERMVAREVEREAREAMNS